MRKPKKPGKVACISKDTNEIIKIYNSCYEAENEFGISRGSIRRCVKDFRKTCHGFIWKFL